MRPSRIVALASVLGFGMLVASSSWAVDPDPEPTDLDPGIVAKLARLKHKNLDGGSDSGNVRVSADQLGNFAQCGSINVGNVVAPKQRLGQQPREINVIVTGSIVNANNKCK